MYSFVHYSSQTSKINGPWFRLLRSNVRLVDVSDTVTTSVLPHNLSSLSSRSRKVDVYSLSQSFRIKNFHFPCETLRFVIQESRYLCQNKVLLFFHLKVFLWVVGFSSVHGSFVYQRRRHIFFFPTQYFRVSTDNSE